MYITIKTHGNVGYQALYACLVDAEFKPVVDGLQKRGTRRQGITSVQIDEPKRIINVYFGPVEIPTPVTSGDLTPQAREALILARDCVDISFAKDHTCKPISIDSLVDDVERP